MTTGVAAEAVATGLPGSGVAIAADGLGKRYGKAWALRECTFALPAGRVVALVGANGAGKSALLSVLAGVLAPTAGRVSLGKVVRRPIGGADGRVAFVAQDKPLYRQFSVADMLRLGGRLNEVWDQARARRWLERFDIPLNRPCGKLSGGQQAQVAFAVALGSRPSVLLLDEPLANLDPLARREVTAELLTEVADSGMTVLLSTHVVAELGGVADHLLLLDHGRLRLDGDLDELLAAHVRWIGPRSADPPVPGEVVHVRHTESQSQFLLRMPGGATAPVAEPPWTTRPVTLEDLVLAHLSTSKESAA
ncbi:ABC transporter ATP-binding protein [Amycolatopsis anabasis]|uniref:ABC transporter ATP-binding protein n=1 Tax=Amycolatopsis anabasis TaxID=1840409 RepID=UPI001FEA5F1F|nr:ABC transporter ATP-binding protein [Amycolatopsis anabasis]